MTFPEDGGTEVTRSVSFPFFKSNSRNLSLKIRAEIDSKILIFENLSLIRDEMGSNNSSINAGLIGTNLESVFLRDLSLSKEVRDTGVKEPFMLSMKTNS